MEKSKEPGLHMGGFTHAAQHPIHREERKPANREKKAPKAPEAKTPANTDPPAPIKKEGDCGCGGA